MINNTNISQKYPFVETTKVVYTFGGAVEDVHPKYAVSLNVDPTGSGTVTGDGSYEYGNSVTVVATPAENYEFDGWYEGETKVSENASYTFTVEGARTLVAKFKEAPDPTAIDLGLPSGRKWRSMNLGATAPEEAGLYFSWGNTTGAAASDADAIAAMTVDAYAETSGAALKDDIPATAANDAAVANLGSPWRMPTKAEFKELTDNCDWTWKQVNGVYGYEVKSKASGNNNSIFLPAAGIVASGTLADAGGIYWSSSFADEDDAYYLYFDQGSASTESSENRSFGMCVRPVQDASA